MIGHLEVMLRRVRRWLSRSEHTARLLRLPYSHETETEPGLVMIQIDGLSRPQMEKAMEQGNLPFLKFLLEKQGYRRHRHYSGLPSSTPSVQGELFYGVRTVVPAFSFYDRKTRRVFRMFDDDACAEIENRLKEKGGEPLLKGGAAYSDIYTGGAEFAHFCGPNLGLPGMFQNGSPFALPFFFIVNIYSFIRTGVLLALEFLLAIVDFFRGLISGQDLWKELKFVPARVGICILARELTVIGAKIDIARGAPVVHLNFLGYDEQAHRRGPTSKFAHWSLKGLDDAIKRLWYAAWRSTRRDYDVWIYSDHGQEETLPYPSVYGETVQEAVARVFREEVQNHHRHSAHRRGEQVQRVRILNWSLFKHLIPPTLPVHDEELPGPIVTAMGPIGHIYPKGELEPGESERLAEALVADAKIPGVFRLGDEERVRFWTAKGCFELPEDAEELFDRDHPFFEEVVDDLIALCRHPDAGDFVISGWRRDAQPFSFPIENGSHAGPGPEETHGFALLPDDAPLPKTEKGYLRPTDLRTAALRHLGREKIAEKKVMPPAFVPAATARQTLRILTYNVHSCLGMDGKISPHRIARIIARQDPDIVALQELDISRPRTFGHDQAQMIAHYLRMDHHFHPALRFEEELYGDAVLSRFPMELVRADSLPGLPGRPRLEPRGAIWVRVETSQGVFHIINTHLGLLPRERLIQTEALLSDGWLGCLGPEESVVLCGDFNATPGSPVVRAISKRLRDVQVECADHRPKKTWFGRYPVGRIDHIFVAPQCKVTKVDVVDTHQARVASDHLPLLVEIQLRD